MPDLFTPIPYGAPLDVDEINDPMRELSDVLNEVLTGGRTLEGLNVGTPLELTINTGAITRSKLAHLIDTEADASEDDLTTINGGTEGDLLFISTVNASRVVVVKHGTGNIDLYSGVDERLDSLRKTIMLRYRDGRWGQVNGLATSASNYNSYRTPYGMPLLPTMAVKNRWEIRASADTLIGMGVASPTKTGTTGTLAVSNQTDSTYINIPSGSTSGNSGGFPTPTYNLVRPSHNPKWWALIRTGAASDLANVRLWFGLTSAALTNVDAIAGATEFIGFRYSTVAADAGFVPVTKDATTQNTGSAMVSIAANSRYLLEAEVDYVNGRVIFRINNGTPVIMTANLPASTVEMGLNFLAFTQAASAKNWLFSRTEVIYD